MGSYLVGMTVVGCYAHDFGGGCIVVGELAAAAAAAAAIVYTCLMNCFLWIEGYRPSQNRERLDSRQHVPSALHSAGY